MTKILLVEDDKSLREIYGVRLLAEGYDIVSAGDGEEALAMAIKERPELIVSDVMMPKISGFDMLDILRSTTETKDIKVIMMTALSSEDQRQRGEQLGADRYLVKSQVGIEDVVRTVHDVLGDIPTAAPNPQQTFGTPAPSAVPRSAPQVADRPAAPVAQPAPTPAPTVAAPAPAPVAAPAPVSAAPEVATPAPTPVASVAPAAPAQAYPAPTPVPPAPQPEAIQESSLPKPTAPFSTPRPSGLGDRIIHPIENHGDTVDMSSLIEKELSGVADLAQPAPAPQADSTPAISYEDLASAAPANPTEAAPEPVLTPVETPGPDNTQPFGIDPTPTPEPGPAPEAAAPTPAGLPMPPEAPQPPQQA